MRATRILRELLGIENTLVVDYLPLAALVLLVRPTWQTPRCSGCGRKVSHVHDVHEQRSWRHLDFGGVVVELWYDLRRIRCRKCGVVVERVPWSDNPESRFTIDFENNVACLAQRMSRTAVEKMMGIAWRTVGRIVQRVVQRLRPKDRTASLERIAVDEISYRKQHHYVTLVSDHDSHAVVWGHEGKSAETLAAFFDQLGEDGCKQIKLVTMDMSKAFIKAVRDRLPDAEIAFDRFHVQSLATDAVDETRREEWRRARGTDTEHFLKGLRWPLLKRPWDLRLEEDEQITALVSKNRRLYRAYLLKEALAGILDEDNPETAEKELNAWISWALRSRLPAFRRVARTIREHLQGILTYIRTRMTNALAEGINTKARLLTRIAYGFHSAEALLAMIMLCCTNLELHPVRKLLSSKQ